MLAGAFAGITEHCIMYPLDSIKTRMQVLHPTSAIYSGILSSFRSMYTTEGARSLWKGVSSVVIGAGPSHALYFATYEKCKEMFGADLPGSSFLATGLAGACSTIVSDGLMNPFDVIKQRMQMQGSNFQSLRDCAHYIFRNEGELIPFLLTIGWSGFFVSYPTTLAISVPFQSIHFIAYEHCKKELNPSGKYDPMSHIISGGLAGALASAVTNPLDVIKTILQTKGSSSNSEFRDIKGPIQACRVLVKYHGMIGFAKGIQPRVLANAPATAICWTSYEFIKHFLNSK